MHIYLKKISKLNLKYKYFGWHELKISGCVDLLLQILVAESFLKVLAE